MNKVELIGRTTKDIELKESAGGTKYARFSLAVRRKFSDKDGNPITDFHNCTAFGKLAEIIATNVKKGDKLFICGELIYNEYETGEGKKKRDADITVSEFEFFGAKKEEPQKPQPKNELTPVDDDSLPF